MFIITDDESPTLGCYGDPIARTPAIDALAADGVVFRNAYATTASCSASRSVILSGLHNHRNGQYGHQHHYHKFFSFEEVGRLSLPNVLRQRGYRTAHIGKYHVAPESVYRFDHYLQGNPRNAVEMANACREFLGAEDDRPFLLYFATADPHRSGQVDEQSNLELKPNLFGNQPHRGSFPGVAEEFYDPAQVPVPVFLPDTPEAREELAQYYQACSRVDAGVARLLEILRDTGLYDQTLIVFTADHGMAFAGGKTTVYEAGLRVPLVVRDPYQPVRGVTSEALVSHVDITPTLLDFAGGLDPTTGGPITLAAIDRSVAPAASPNAPRENTNGGLPFDRYHGRSWLRLLAEPTAEHWDTLFASHTFHEIQMYYPMRVVRDRHYKPIWNIAHPLPFPFASDLWAAASWQGQYRHGPGASYGGKTIAQYLQRPAFELFDIRQDPDELHNLADRAEYAEVLQRYQERLRRMQLQLHDPWVLKWQYE